MSRTHDVARDAKWRGPMVSLLLVITACGDGTPLDPSEVHEPAFAIAGCELEVSDEEALKAIATLIAGVNALESSGSLNAGQARALRNHLMNAQRALLEGRRCAAQAQLRAVREQVANFVADGVLPAGEADPLLDTLGDVLNGRPVTESISQGGFHSCGVTSSGRAYCWGFNNFGQLGDGTTLIRPAPVPVAGNLRFADIEASWDHTCALTVDGAAYCWGANAHGQLGDGTSIDRALPTAVAGQLVFTSLSSSNQHTCGITTTGAAYCWGDNRTAGLGDGTTISRQMPVAVAGGVVFTAIAAGAFHTCGLSIAGVAYCWGLNTLGAVGDGTVMQRTSPTPVAGGLEFWTITAGGEYSCALAVTGTAYCWGANQFGQLGDGTLDLFRLTPAPVSSASSFDYLDSGGGHSCGITTNLAPYCWGLNDGGQIGDGTLQNRRTPVPVSGGHSFRLIDAGAAWHTCALTTDDVAYCWGPNFEGQVGDGTRQFRFTPTAVLGWTQLQ